MQTKFEHYAASSMIGADDAPPRRNGQLAFDQEWQRRAFGVAMALAKQGHYEWEDFRQGLIAAIGEWEDSNEDWSQGWDYYQRWLLALERLALAQELVSEEELDRRTSAYLEAADHAAPPLG